MQVWSILLSVTQTATILTAAIWTYFRFFKEGSHKARIGFDVSCEFYGPHHGRYVAAFRVHAHNHGNVEHRFESIRLRALGLKREDALVGREDATDPTLSFPEPLFKKVELVPESFGYFFVRPGVKQAFTYTAHLPGDVAYLVARATFQYGGSKDLHTAERVFEVRSTSED